MSSRRITREGYLGEADSARLFVGILLPADTRSEIAAATAEARRIDGLRWGATDQLHITLRFIGDTEKQRVPSIQSAILAAAAPLSPFRVDLQGGGAFPSSGRPSVVWVGVRPTPPLLRLYDAVEDALAGEGIDPDQRAFRPHVTLARVKRGPPPIGLARALAELALETSFDATAVSLMRSELTPQGAKHFEIRSCRLGNETTESSPTRK